MIEPTPVPWDYTNQADWYRALAAHIANYMKRRGWIPRDLDTSRPAVHDYATVKAAQADWMDRALTCRAYGWTPDVQH